MPELADIQRAWDDAARTDAIGNIIAIPDITEDEFFESGRREIAGVLARLDTLGFAARQSALDFGCGIGRLTVALADHFECAVGVDVSREMIARARPARNAYYLRSDDIRHFGEFDLAYSNITLQHMPTELQRDYVDQLIGTVIPNGLAVFEIPDGPTPEAPYTAQTMFGTPRRLVETWIRATEATLIDAVETGSAAPAMRSVRYVVRP